MDACPEPASDPGGQLPWIPGMMADEPSDHIHVTFREIDGSGISRKDREMPQPPFEVEGRIASRNETAVLRVLTFPHERLDGLVNHRLPRQPGRISCRIHPGGVEDLCGDQLKGPPGEKRRFRKSGSSWHGEGDV
jgi:hypothetical protein